MDQSTEFRKGTEEQRQLDRGLKTSSAFWQHYLSYLVSSPRGQTQLFHLLSLKSAERQHPQGHRQDSAQKQKY